jgi:hypothetical protein
MPRRRVHKSSIVVGLIVALLLVLIEIPGRVVSIDGHPRHQFRFSALRKLERIKTLEIWRPTILD